jgi:hypothetical protein
MHRPARDAGLIARDSGDVYPPSLAGRDGFWGRASSHVVAGYNPVVASRLKEWLSWQAITGRYLALNFEFSLIFGFWPLIFPFRFSFRHCPCRRFSARLHCPA